MYDLLTHHSSEATGLRMDFRASEDANGGPKVADARTYSHAFAHLHLPTQAPVRNPNLGSVAGPNPTLSNREGEGVATVAAAVTPMENDQPASKSEEQTQMHTDRSEHHSPGRYPANVWLFNEMERNGNDSGGGSVAVQPESLLCFKPPRAAYTPSSKERVDHYDPVRAAAG